MTFLEPARTTMEKKVALQRKLCKLTPPMDLGGEWLTEAEMRDKSSRNESWRSNQHNIHFEQAKEF